MDWQEIKARVGSGENLDRANSRYASINSSKPVWWIEIPLRMFNDVSNAHVHLLLVDQHLDAIHHLRVPKDYLVSNMAKLDVRDDKEMIALQLSSEESSLFVNDRPTGSGLPFAQFLVRTV